MQSVIAEIGSQLVRLMLDTRISTLVSPTAEPNSNLGPAPNERTLIESREGAEPKLSHRSVPSTARRENSSGLWVG